MPRIKPAIIVCRDAGELAGRAADIVIQASQDAIGARGRFMIALAGGSTPEKTYSLLARPPQSEVIDWSNWMVFFGDERFVPPDDERSNFGMARRALLASVPIPSDHIYPVDTSLPSPAEAADAYARALAGVFSLPVQGVPPRFDLILLGMGDDGHTASLFPHMPSLAIKDAWVISSPPGTLPPPVDRITFTYPLLNAARQVVFLVSGEGKAKALREALEGDASPDVHPAAGVHPENGALTWLVDTAAARLLTEA